MKAARCALLLSLAMLAAGCVQSAEVNRLALIDLLALDAAEAGEILLTAQVIMPTRLGVGPSSTGGEGAPFFLAQARGRTVAEALSNLQKKVPRQIFLEHLQMLVIGDELARRGLFPVVDFLVREQQVRTDLLVAVTPGEAATLLNIASPLPAVPGEAWNDLVRDQRIAVSSVRNLFVALGEEGMDPFLTAIAPSSVQEPGGGTDLGDMELIGAGLMRGDRLAGYLNREEAIGLQLLLNDRPRTVVSVPADAVLTYLGGDRGTPGTGGPGDTGGTSGGAGAARGPDGASRDPVHPRDLISLQLQRATTYLAPFADDPPTLRFQARLITEVVNTTSLLDVENPEVAAAVERAAADIFRGFVEGAVRQMQAVNSDAAGFGASFRRSRPEWWRGMREQWAELFPRMQMVYDIEVLVVRTGLATRPAGPEPQLEFPGRGGGTQ
ncbi:MAG: Ger(x)C family spore germination C-terminal domain-containing protein [Bacillota bacterium]